jgi:hypothetical protein
MLVWYFNYSASHHVVNTINYFIIKNKNRKEKEACQFSFFLISVISDVLQKKREAVKPIIHEGYAYIMVDYRVF